MQVQYCKYHSYIWGCYTVIGYVTMTVSIDGIATMLKQERL